MFVRWQNLTLSDDEQARLPGYHDEAVVRRFDAPEALDMRFYEVRSRSVLNRVPAASRMPFRWTINPYRGCSHACVYCLGGETPILMADGRTKPIADLRVGDALYGTVLDGVHRRLAVTRVMAHWSTVKPAYGLRLEDGTELSCSRDHRFLTDSGWRYVIGVAKGQDRRPGLEVGSRLMGTQRFVEAPRHSLEGVAVEAHKARRVASIDSLGASERLYDITTGTGDFIANGVVSHNCFARDTHRYLDFDAGRDFEREIVVKVNAPEVVRAELSRPSWKREHVAMGTNTDPYQWVEGRYRLMPDIWAALRDSATPCSVLTKSPLLLRDLSCMLEVAERTSIAADLSIPTLDEKAWRATEPHTPHPRARLEAVAELNRAGIETGVLVAPLMPGINDAPHQLGPLLDAIAEAGAVRVAGIGLHLRGEVRGVFLGWLREHHPELVDRYEEIYRRGAYAPRAERQRMARLVREDPRTPRGERSFMRVRGNPSAEAPEKPDSVPLSSGGREMTLF